MSYGEEVRRPPPTPEQVSRDTFLRTDTDTQEWVRLLKERMEKPFNTRQVLFRANELSPEDKLELVSAIAVFETEAGALRQRVRTPTLVLVDNEVNDLKDKFVKLVRKMTPILRKYARLNRLITLEQDEDGHNIIRDSTGVPLMTDYYVTIGPLIRSVIQAGGGRLRKTRRHRKAHRRTNRKTQSKTQRRTRRNL